MCLLVPRPLPPPREKFRPPRGADLPEKLGRLKVRECELRFEFGCILLLSVELYDPSSQIK